MGLGCGPMTMKNLYLFIMIMLFNMSHLQGLEILPTGRFLGRVDNTSESSRPFDQDTVRADPLDGLNKYRGGYDVTNKHYWSSTAYTGIPGYALAVVWILSGLGYGAYLVVASACCSSRGKLKRKREPCKQQCFLFPLLVAVVLTVLAVMGCGLVLGGNASFHSRAKKVIDLIIDTADEASNTLYETTGAMKDMDLSLRGVGGSSKLTGFLTSTSERLDTQAYDIQTQASKNRRNIDKGIKIAYIITTVTISLTFVAVIALLVFGALNFSRTRNILVAVCWIFTVLCWFYFGIYIFLQNFAGDTCTALESFQKDPYNNSLSSILPCDELLSAKSALNDVSAGVYNIVRQVNRNISTTYGNLFQICNPFSPPPRYEYQPWNCSATSIKIGNISQVLRMLACPDSEGETCNGGISMPSNLYYSVESYSTSLQKLVDVYPGVESLVECQTVKDTFATILHQHCSPLKRHVRMVWASLVFLSVVMVALALVWIIESHHHKRHHSLGGSVKPHNNDDEELESTTDKTDHDGSNKEALEGDLHSKSRKHKFFSRHAYIHAQKAEIRKETYINE